MKEKQLQQKKRRILWGWILAVLLLSISMGTINVQAAKLKLNKTKVTVYKGCTETLKVTGSKKKVKWSSSKKAVASVSSSGSIVAGNLISLQKLIKRITEMKLMRH